MLEQINSLTDQNAELLAKFKHRNQVPQSLQNQNLIDEVKRLNQIISKLQKKVGEESESLMTQNSKVSDTLSKNLLTIPIVKDV